MEKRNEKDKGKDVSMNKNVILEASLKRSFLLVPVFQASILKAVHKTKK